MIKPNTTVDFAAYGLCQHCATLMAENIRDFLMYNSGSHLKAMAFVMDMDNEIIIKMDGKRDALVRMALHLLDEAKS